MKVALACDFAESKGTVPMTSVVRALFALQHAGLEGRMRITFELFDSRRSGRIDRMDLFEILKVKRCVGKFYVPCYDYEICHVDAYFCLSQAISRNLRTAAQTFCCCREKQ